MGNEQSFRLIADAMGPGSGAMDWGRLVWIADRASSDVGATVGYVEIFPHAANPIHRHHTCSEIITVLDGNIEHIVGEETVDLRKGDALIVPPGMRHGARNVGATTARMIVAYDTGERDFEVAD